MTSCCAAVFAWGIASHLDVRVVGGPDAMRAAATDAAILFEASESGDVEVRMADGGCAGGRIVATDRYGPGWEETDRAPAVGRVTLGGRLLHEGENSLLVCVRHGVARGADGWTVVVDDTSPGPGTLEITPTEGIGGSLTAHTRALRFSGTSPEPGATLEFNEAHGRTTHELEVRDGRWLQEWHFSPIVDEISIALIVVDAAGNTSRAPMLHVSFVGIDRPPVALPAYPGVSIECRGSPPLAAHDCRAWAKITLERHPDLFRDAVRILLAMPDQYGACYAESRDSDGFTGVGLVVDCAR